MLEELKSRVCAANLELVEKGIVIYTWGKVSGISDDRKHMVIRPSGVDYARMQTEDKGVAGIETGERVEEKWNPSSDSKTHLELYRKYSAIKGIVHTYFTNAVAQAGIDIPVLGTTQADFLRGHSLCKGVYERGSRI